MAPPRYVHIKICPRRHPEHPFDSNNLVGTDTVRVGIRGVRPNIENLEQLGQAWSTAMDENFDEKLALPDPIPSGMLQFHEQNLCPFEIGKDTLSVQDMAESFSTVIDAEPAEIEKKLIHIHIIGPEPWDRLPPAIKLEHEDAPRFVRMILCPKAHSKAEYILFKLDVFPQGRLARNIGELGRLIAEKLQNHTGVDWSSLQKNKAIWRFHARKKCKEEDLSIEDMVKGFLCRQDDESDPKDQIVWVHLGDARKPEGRGQASKKGRSDEKLLATFQPWRE